MHNLETMKGVAFKIYAFETLARQTHEVGKFAILLQHKILECGLFETHSFEHGCIGKQIPNSGIKVGSFSIFTKKLK